MNTKGKAATPGGCRVVADFTTGDGVDVEIDAHPESRTAATLRTKFSLRFFAALVFVPSR